MKRNILIIDDESGIRAFLSMILEDEFDVFDASNSAEAYEILQREKISLVLLDLMLGSENGMDVLREIRHRFSDTAVIMMTAFGDIQTSVEAIKVGAFHYLCKPLNTDELLLYIHQALEFQRLNRRIENLNQELIDAGQRGYYGNIIGKSDAMQDVYKLIDKVKDVNTSVIITGESGTGKELVAREIHKRGSRASENFVSVNCAAIPEGLLEVEFFGHSKGSFTGAVSDRKGKLELADHGTLFLDEIGDMPLVLQGKLLRVFQEKEMTPIGSSVTRKIDIRVICATNRNLPEMVKAGEFRSDLYYRLQVVTINMPPLRERREDIPGLCEVFLKRLNRDMKKNINGLTPEAISYLVSYDFPGNVRELTNMLEYACIVCDGNMIDVRDFPRELSSCNMDKREMLPGEAVNEYLSGLAIKDVEEMMIVNALKNNGGNKRAAARELGISERSLFNKINDYKINDYKIK